MSSERTSGGIGVAGLLGVSFVVLKLTGVIGWSWWWVTAPFWGGAVLCAVLIILDVTIAGFIKANRMKRDGNVPPEFPVKKSRWQQRLEELQAQQKAQRKP